MNDKEFGSTDFAGDDRNSEKSSSLSYEFIAGGERAVCEGVCERDPGGGGSGDITPVDSDPNESLPIHCFREEVPWESIGRELGLGFGTGDGVEKLLGGGVAATTGRFVGKIPFTGSGRSANDDHP